MNQDIKEHVEKTIERVICANSVTDLGDISVLQEYGNKVADTCCIKLADIEECAKKLKEGNSKSALMFFILSANMYRIKVDLEWEFIKSDLDVIGNGKVTSLDDFIMRNKERQEHKFPEECKKEYLHCNDTKIPDWNLPPYTKCTKEQMDKCKWHQWHENYKKKWKFV